MFLHLCVILFTDHMTVGVSVQWVSVQVVSVQGVSVFGSLSGGSLSGGRGNLC